MDKGKKSALAFLFYLIIGFVVFVVFSHIRPLFSWSVDLAGRFIAIAILLLASLRLKRMERDQQHSLILYGFLTASVALFLDY